MKKLYALFLGVCCSMTAWGQNLVQSNFTGLIVPQYMASGTGNRLPVAFRGTVSGLTANTLYRYYAQGATNSTANGGSADIGTTNSGAGNSLLIQGATFTYPSTPSLSTAGGYATFTTDAAGTYTGWFAFVNTGNTRFTAGNIIYPSITLAPDASVTTANTRRYALDQTITVLAFATTAGATNGTGIYGNTATSLSKDFVALYDNVGSTGRPLAVTYLEDEGVAVASTVGYYSTNVNGQNGRWGTLIPNNNANGVRSIVRYRLSDGTLAYTDTDADGVWPSGANTVNPTGGTTPVFINGTDSSLPVTYLSFQAKNTGAKTVAVTWETVSEADNLRFEVERSSDAITYTTLGQVAGRGTTTNRQTYAFTDEAPAPGWNYYRLRQTDTDGTASLSRPVAVLNESALDAGLVLAPNPAGAQVRLMLANGEKAEQATIISLSGQRVSLPMPLPETLDVAQLPSALYLLEVQTSTGRVLRQRLLKH